MFGTAFQTLCSLVGGLIDGVTMLVMIASLLVFLYGIYELLDGWDWYTAKVVLFSFAALVLSLFVAGARGKLDMSPIDALINLFVIVGLVLSVIFFTLGVFGLITHWDKDSATAVLVSFAAVALSLFAASARGLLYGSHVDALIDFVVGVGCLFSPLVWLAFTLYFLFEKRDPRYGVIALFSFVVMMLFLYAANVRGLPIFEYFAALRGE
jgi:hypothetical protein